MTEQEMTVAVEAAARAFWAKGQEEFEPRVRVSFDEVDVMTRIRVREAVMPLALAAAEAVLPAAQHAAWNAGHIAADNGIDETANPYPVVL